MSDDCCCEIVTGACTTRWYPLQGVPFFGNPDDCFTYDHINGTSKVVVTAVGSEYYTWILGQNIISKTGIPDGSNPTAIWKGPIVYTPPEDSELESRGPSNLVIYTMESCDNTENHAVILGTHVKISLVSAQNSNIDSQFPGDIITYQRYPSDEMGVYDVCKVDLVYQDSGPEFFSDYAIPTGGYLRLGISQWLPITLCGGVGFGSLVASDGSIHWVAPDLAIDLDSSNTIAEGESEKSHFLVGIFTISQCIPEDHLGIAAITINISRYASADSSSVNVKDSVLQISNGGELTGFGINRADTSTKWPTTLETVPYSGDLSYWGIPDLGTNVEKKIVVRLQVDFGRHGVTAFVDQLSLSVTYLLEGGGTSTITVNDLYANDFDDLPVRVSDIEFDLPGYNGAYYFGGSVYTDYISTPVKFPITGSDVAAAITPYLYEAYSVSGTGTLTGTTKATLTFSQDGSIEGVQGKYLIELRGLVTFPNEAATLHMLDYVSNVTWSRCANQRTEFNDGSGFGGGIQPLAARATKKIVYDPDNQEIHTFGGKLYPLNKWSVDGDMVECGAYLGSFNQLSSSVNGTYGKNWVCMDRLGYAYSQEGKILSKYGPDGKDAELNLIWTTILPFSITQWDICGDFLIGGTYLDEGTDSGKVGIVHIEFQYGNIGWVTYLHSNSTRQLSVVGPSFFPLFEIHIDTSSTPPTTVTVSAFSGAYELLTSNGELINYYPHGNICLSSRRITTGGDNFLVLTGARTTKEIPIEFYDLDPETLV